MRINRKFITSLGMTTGSVIILEFGIGLLIGVIGSVSDAYANGAPLLTVMAALAIPLAVCAGGAYLARFALRRFWRVLLSWRAPSS